VFGGRRAPLAMTSRCCGCLKEFTCFSFNVQFCNDCLFSHFIDKNGWPRYASDEGIKEKKHMNFVLDDNDETVKVSLEMDGHGNVYVLFNDIRVCFFYKETGQLNRLWLTGEKALELRELGFYMKENRIGYNAE
jgi:hypothetical protein